MSTPRARIGLAGVVAGVVVALAVVIMFVVGGDSDGRSRLDELARDPLLVDTPVSAEVVQPPNVDAARDEAFGVEEEFHTAVARWSVTRSVDDAATAWANLLIGGDVWHDVVAVCREYADGRREVALGARRSTGGYSVSANVDVVSAEPGTSQVSVTLVVPVDGRGDQTTDAQPDLACLHSG